MNPHGAESLSYFAAMIQMAKRRRSTGSRATLQLNDVSRQS